MEMQNPFGGMNNGMQQPMNNGMQQPMNNGMQQPMNNSMQQPMNNGMQNQGMAQGNPFAQPANNPFGGVQVQTQQCFQQPMNNGFAGQGLNNVEPVNPFSNVPQEIDNSQYIANNNAMQFNGTVQKKGVKLLHFEYLPFGKRLGIFDISEVQKYKKLCMWMHFLPLLIFAPLLSDECKKSGYVRETANSLFGFYIKYAIIMAIFGALHGMMFGLSIMLRLRGLGLVLTGLFKVCSAIIGIFMFVIFIRSLICTKHGERFGHLFTTSYFND